MRHFSIGQRVIGRNDNGKEKWAPDTVHAQLGLLSYEIEIGPNLVWLRHLDQIKDSNVPVADNHTSVIQSLPFPPPVENSGDVVAEPSEQTEVVLRETNKFSAIQSSGQIFGQ